MTHDETQFRTAARTDATARLVLADYLDEQGKPVEAALERVLAEPASDEHRLHYADAVERAGDKSRAEFVRIQVELARVEHMRRTYRPDHTRACTRKKQKGGRVRAFEPSGTCERCQYLRAAWKVEQQKRQERQLLEAHRTTWLSGSPCTIDAWSLDEPMQPYVYGMRVQFRRGFVTSLICSAADWLKHAEAARASHPVEQVRLTTHPDTMELYRICAEVGMGGSPGNRIERHIEILGAKWPGVAFELPPPIITADWNSAPGATPISDLRAWRGRLNAMSEPI